MDIIFNYIFFFLGRFAWKILKISGLVVQEFGDWGYVALGLVVFILIVLASIISLGGLWR